MILLVLNVLRCKFSVLIVDIVLSTQDDTSVCKGLVIKLIIFLLRTQILLVASRELKPLNLIMDYFKRVQA